MRGLEPLGRSCAKTPWRQTLSGKPTGGCHRGFLRADRYSLLFSPTELFLSGAAEILSESYHTPAGVWHSAAPDLDPRHWNLFAPETLKRLLTDSGLEVLGILFQTGHSFWMYSFHHRIRYQGNSRPGLGKLFDPVRSLVGIACFTGLDLIRAALGSKTSAILVIARKP